MQRSTRGLHIPDLIATEHALTDQQGKSFESFASIGRDDGDQAPVTSYDRLRPEPWNHERITALRNIPLLFREEVHPCAAPFPRPLFSGRLLLDRVETSHEPLSGRRSIVAALRRPCELEVSPSVARDRQEMAGLSGDPRR